MDTLKTALNVGELTQAKFNETKNVLDKLQQDTEVWKAKVTALAPDNARVDLLMTSALDSIEVLNTQFPQLQANATIAIHAITGMQDFLATLKHNPVRRLISIFLDAYMGLAISGILGLDLIQAALQTQTLAADRVAPGSFLPGDLHGGVVLTGIIIGLGANPVHEVIRAIQEYKKARKTTI